MGYIGLEIESHRHWPGESDLGIDLRCSGLGILDVEIDARGTDLSHNRSGIE